MKKISIALLVVAATSLMAADGATLTKNCIGCHGVNFEKPPLGRTDHIAINNSFKDLVKKIKYFQNPEDSDEMVMKPYVSKLSDEEINTIAKYIFSKK